MVCRQSGDHIPRRCAAGHRCVYRAVADLSSAPLAKADRSDARNLRAARRIASRRAEWIMTSRNRTIAVAGLLKLGDGLDAVLKLLPPERRQGIARRLETK